MGGVALAAFLRAAVAIGVWGPEAILVTFSFVEQLLVCETEANSLMSDVRQPRTERHGAKMKLLSCAP